MLEKLQQEEFALTALKICRGIADKHEKGLSYKYAKEYAETMIKLFDVSEPNVREIISYLKEVYHQN